MESGGDPSLTSGMPKKVTCSSVEPGYDLFRPPDGCRQGPLPNGIRKFCQAALSLCPVSTGGRPRVPNAGRVIAGYADLPPEVRKQAGETGEMSTDMTEGPIAAQSWYVLDALRRTLQAAGGDLNDVVKLTQYFRDLRDFPIYNRIRSQFFAEPPASTVVQVSALLPTSDALLEVDATAYIPLKPRS
jgi:enamine deaminase RidA (YjgF/YER057c/UK114 family)